MLSMIVDYILLVIIKILMAVFFAGLAGLAIFLAYWIFCDYTTAVMTLKGIAFDKNGIGKFFATLVFVGCFFHTSEYKSSPKKFNTNKYLDRVFFEHDSGNRMF